MSYRGDTQVRVRKDILGKNPIRTGVCRSRRTRCGCRFRLHSSTRLSDGIPSRPERRFAIAQRHGSPLLSSPVCCRAVGSWYPRRGSVLGGFLLPPCSDPSATAIRKNGSANALRTTTSYEQALAARFKIVAPKPFRVHNCWGACSSGRRGDSRSYGAMPLLSCPRRSAVLLSVDRIQNKAWSAGVLRPRGSVPPAAAIRMRGAANALRTTTPYEQASASRGKLVVDVGMGYSLARDCWRACSCGRGRDSRLYGTKPLLPCPRRSAVLLWVGGIEDGAPSAAMIRPPCSVHPVTVVRKYGPANALRTTTSYEQAFAARAKLVVDLGLGYIRERGCR